MHTIQLRPTESDNAPAIVKALAELRERGGGKLLLEAGCYMCRGGRLRPDGRTHDPSVRVSDLKEITIDGQGATFVGRDIAQLFLFSDSENITVRNLTINWDPCPTPRAKSSPFIPNRIHTI